MNEVEEKLIDKLMEIITHDLTLELSHGSMTLLLLREYNKTGTAFETTKNKEESFLRRQYFVLVEFAIFIINHFYVSSVVLSSIFL